MPRITFVEANGTRREVESPANRTLLSIAHANKIPIEGACEGSMACSTCHVIVDPAWYGKLKPAGTEESDMLDLTYGITKTSRLGCQILLTDELDGLVVALPSETRNMML
jgi:ferredoxin, 2Fe-2S